MKDFTLKGVSYEITKDQTTGTHTVKASADYNPLSWIQVIHGKLTKQKVVEAFELYMDPHSGSVDDLDGWYPNNDQNSDLILVSVIS